jgi:Co/Zn/Cd efflux system component
LIKPDGDLDDALLDGIQNELHARFGIDHVTVQLECGAFYRSCLQEPNNIV